MQVSSVLAWREHQLSQALVSWVTTAKLTFAGGVGKSCLTGKSLATVPYTAILDVGVRGVSPGPGIPHFFPLIITTDFDYILRHSLKNLFGS